MFGGKRCYIYFHTFARKEYKHCVKTDNRFIILNNSNKVSGLECYFKGTLHAR